MSGMQVSFKFEGITKLADDAKAAGANADVLVKSALVNSATEVQSQQRTRAAHRTGTLQRSILTEIRYPEAIVTVQEKYGLYLEQGTGIYGPNATPIVPKRAKALAFTAGGSLVFAKSSKGIKKRPFFVPGYQAATGFINSQFVQVAERLRDAIKGRG